MSQTTEQRAATAQDFADLIVQEHCRSVAAIIRQGELLIEANEVLEYGQWVGMFRGPACSVARPVPYSISKAERLMKIARNPVLKDSAHGPNLPASWRTLYELAKLKDLAVLLSALADGRVHPEMERRDAEAILAPPPVPKPRPASPPLGFEAEFRELARLEREAEAVRQHLADRRAELERRAGMSLPLPGVNAKVYRAFIGALIATGAEHCHTCRSYHLDASHPRRDLVSDWHASNLVYRYWRDEHGQYHLPFSHPADGQCGLWCCWCVG